MTAITITGTVTDSSGAVGTYTAQVSTDTVTAAAVVSPTVAPPGTTRIITVTGTSSAGLPLSFGTPQSAGIVFTPVTGQPNQWTFVF